jgi:hypothetical protein
LQTPLFLALSIPSISALVNPAWSTAASLIGPARGVILLPQAVELPSRSKALPRAKRELDFYLSPIRAKQARNESGNFGTDSGAEWQSRPVVKFG